MDCQYCIYQGDDILGRHEDGCPMIVEGKQRSWLAQAWQSGWDTAASGRYGAQQAPLGPRGPSYALGARQFRLSGQPTVKRKHKHKTS